MKSNKLYRIFALILTIAMLVNMFAGTIVATEEPTPPASGSESEVPTQPTDEPEQGSTTGTTALKAWLTLEEVEETTETTPSEEPTEPTTTAAEEEPTESSEEPTTTAAEEEPTESSEETPAQRTVKTEETTEATTTEATEETTTEPTEETTTEATEETTTEPTEETTTEATEETTTEPTEETTTEATEETTTEPAEATTTEATEETTTEVTEATTQAPAKIIYTYTLHVMLGNNEIPFDGTDTKLQSVTWKMAGAQEALADDTISNTYAIETDAAVEATIVYDGLVLALSSEKNLVAQTDSAEDAEAKKLTWGIATDASVTGTIFTSMKGSATLTMPTLSEGCSFAEGIAWSVDADELKLENNTLTLETAATKNTQNVTVSAIGKDKTVYAQSTVEVALVKPDLEFAVEASDKLIGVDAASTIKFIVTEKTEGHLAGFNAKLYSVQLINAETNETVKTISDLTFAAGQHGDKEAQIATWSIAASEEIKDGNYTIAFAEQKASVTIDTTAPVVELIVDGKIYQNDGKYFVMPKGAEVKNDGENALEAALGIKVSIDDANYSGEKSFSKSVPCDIGMVTEIVLDELIGNIVDDAGNAAQKIIIKEAPIADSNVTVYVSLAPSECFYVDRESPSVEFPEACIERVGAEDLSAEKIVFKATINEGENGSGLYSVTYQVKDPMCALAEQSGPLTDAVGEGNYSVEILVNEGKETNLGELSITATDNVGNSRTMTYDQKICADRRAPEATVILPQNPFKEVDGVQYFATEQIVIVRIDEINFDSQKASVSIRFKGEENAITIDEAEFAKWNRVGKSIWTKTKDNVYEASFTVNDTTGRVIEAILVDMEDSIGNKAEQHAEAASFVIDTNPAVIDIIMPNEPVEDVPEAVKEIPGEKEVTQDDVEYYSEKQKIIIKVYEDNFDDKNTTVKYTLSDGTELNVKNETIGEDTDLSATWVPVSDENGNYYMAEFEIIDTNGRIVESVTVEAALMAEDNQTVTDSSDKFVVDTVVPLLSITMPQDATVTDPETSEVTPNTPKNVFENISYYPCAQTITLKIEETNFDADSVKIELSLGETTYTEDNLADVECITLSDWTSDNGIHTATIEVADTKGLTVESIKVSFEDKAATSVEETIEDKKFVVDSNDPTMDIAFSENVVGFYLSDSETDAQKVYLILNKPVTTAAMNASNIVGLKQKVTVTVTIKDDNITDLENNYFVVNLAGEESLWKMNESACAINAAEDTIVYVYEIEVNANETAEIPLLFRVRDLAGRKPLNFEVKDSEEEAYTSFDVAFNDEGETNNTIVVDRTQATTGTESEPPVIDASIPETSMKAANGMPLYNKGFKATFTVYDYDSGIQSIEWMIDDGLEEDFFDASWNSTTYSSTMKFAAVTAVVDLEGQENETNNAKLVIKVTDNVGNVITKTYLFAVDTMNPRIDITMPQDLENNDPSENGTDYYSKEQLVTLQVTDINFKTASVELNKGALLPSDSADAVVGWEKRWTRIENTDTYEAIIIVRDTAGVVVNEVKVINAVDYADNEYSEARNEPFVVDLTAPVVTIDLPQEQMIEDAETGAMVLNAPVNTFDVIDYYAAKQDVVITVEEDNFDEAAVTISYEKNGEIIKPNVKWTSEGNVNTTSFRIPDTRGLVIESVSVEIQDKAMRRPVDEDGAEVDVVTESDKFIVDEKDPVVVIDMPQDQVNNSPVNTFDGIDYYATGDENIVIKVTEDNFDASYITVKYWRTARDETESKEVTFDGQWQSVDNVHTLTIPVNDNGGTYETVSVDIKDKTLRAPNTEVSEIETTDYFVVDTARPEVDIEFSNNVIGFYTEKDENGVENPNKIYLMLKEPVIGSRIEDDEAATAWTQPVTVIVTITDDNLLEKNANIGEQKSKFVVSNVFVREDVEAWKLVSSSCVANQKDKIVYKIELSVLGNEVKEIPLMLQVQDLAGWKPEDEQVQAQYTITDENGNEIDKVSFYDVEFDDKGKTNETIYVDHRQPSSLNDENVLPEIQLTLPDTVGTSTNEKPLYNGSFEIGFTVTDNDSGLHKVEWSIDDGLNGNYFTDAGEVIYDTTVREDNYTAKVELGDRQNATNDAILTIIATDNVGNSITYTYEFAVDTKATEIAIDMPQDHDTNYNTIEDVDYYNANQTINLTVNDINFEPNNTVVSVLIDGVKTVISAEEGATAKWVETWTTEDAASGIYTASFMVSDTAGCTIENVLLETTDKSGWSSEAKDERALVVDTTLPVAVITLPQERADNAPVNTFDPMDYYDANQTVYLQITDDNFFADYTTVSYMKNGDEVYPEVVWTAAEGSNVYKARFLLEDTEGLSIDSVTVVTEDMALNTLAEGIDGLTDADPFVIDTVKPEVNITFSNNVIAFYNKKLNDTEADASTVYLMLDETVNRGNEVTEQVTVTVEITDDNITEAENKYYLENLVPGAVWTKSVSCELNSADDKVIYVGTVQVAANEVVEIPMMLRIIDLAGNIPEDSEIEKEFGTKYTVEYDEDGKTNETIHIDRRQPTSIEDESVAPKIAISMPTPVYELENEVPLFNGDFNIDFTVIDPNSGLKSVQWSIDDGLNKTFFFAEFDKDYTQEATTITKDSFTAKVELNGKKNETNTAKLTIIAEDNVGNIITCDYDFAVDNKAPRVTVKANNNSALNGKYFMATRLITVTVEDLNFNPDMVAIDTQIEGTKNIDTERGVYTYNYVDDGEYSLIVTKVVDLAGNITGGQNNVEGFLDYSDCVAYNDFVIDLTAPVISLSFDNNAVKNDKYYNADRLATATIREVNFNASEVEATVTADLDGAAFNHATFDVWSGATDHVSTVLFETDGDYNISIAYTDLAGNPAQTHVEPEFTIDKTAPEAEISNIEDHSANKGTVAPTVSFADINLDPNGYNTVVTQASMETTMEVNLSMVPDEGNNYKLVKHLYNDIPSEKSYDGVYVMTATVTDLAGNTDTDSKMFSVNRFGSTYIIEDPATKAIKDGYSKEAIAIEVIEINPNEVENQAVSAIINSGSGFEDYIEGETLTIAKSGSEESWKRYTYTISADAFMDGDALKQGKYEMSFYSEDTAGNKNSNETNVDLEANTCELSFTLDNTAPVVEIVNLEDDQTIEYESYDVTIRFSDGYALKKVEIWLDGELYKTLEGEELASANGEYVLTIPEMVDEREINVHAVDVAGNEYTTDTLHFFINSNWFLRFYHNKPLFFGSIGGGVILIGLIVLLIKKMKNAKKAKVS